MQWSLFKALALAAVLQASSAAPADGKLKVVKTTTTPGGQVIDWVVPESQGTIASPPPAPEKRSGKQPRIETLIPHMEGPEGAVPILRSGGPTLSGKRLPQPSDHGAGSGDVQRRASAAGSHWYASSGQTVANTGGKATFSLFKPYVQSGSDFSLIQAAVVYDNAAHAGPGGVTQTVEAGWINFPNQEQAPHLFSFFTTNGYASQGDNVGGWNRDHAGWVQTDGTIFPGMAFTTLSTDGGAQHELQIGYQLHQGNWWLWVQDRYVGYYPASLFSQNVSPGSTLAGGSDRISFYGEVFNSEDQVTTTDMGSGEFPDKGFGHAAYLHNIVYYDANGNAQDYDGGGQIIVSDQARYRIQTSFKSGGSWGSFFYLGGPGAGGVVGG
ncbi:hypothetical protein TOPH_04861 [Tolypocladium ophioglossoides CBS 100239]|uniref:Neprosin PEP catalytic domain-containing protein n=1 Tax=Tolypocladium ophioglossoides (strain CBS 100239) TaxID=1163406 RepID=A0A0L0N8Z5_TOLOC|nr:hypothetical protein TOPH_04861 [Tolypocladium ophioglossoides CBS 100239]